MREAPRARAGAWTVALTVLAGCGGSSPAAPPPPTPHPPTPRPATLADLSAVVSSTEADTRINCLDDVHARVSLTNAAPSGVLVTGVHKTSSVVSGGCTPAREFTYPVLPRVVDGSSSAVVLDRALYEGGSGCCPFPNGCSGSCDFQETLEVVTEVGVVPAGSFRYNVTFTNCAACAVTTGVRVSACPPRVAGP